jgi:glucose/arabinose dehydrogenase
VSSGLSNPVGLANAGDGSGRLFVLEQRGFIRILQDGELLQQPFLDISAQVDCCGERGLLGITFHPDYAQNGYFYINYTEVQAGQLTTVIARYQVSADANTADASSEVRLFEQPQPYQNHNGGGLAFGPDGYLYIGLGDGGSGGDPQGNAQSTDTKLGKLLRLDVDGGEPYIIPPDNPFGRGGGIGEIWAYGLRNPWRFSFDSLTGDLYIGDVGQGAWEEIDFQPAGSPGGANYGWNYREGAHPYAGEPPADVTLIEPVAEYSHAEGISVTAGYVYRGPSLAEWQGVFLYGDYGSGYVWGLLRKADGTWENNLMFQTETSVTSFGVDEAGEIYLVDYRGNIFRLDRK